MLSIQRIGLGSWGRGRRSVCWWTVWEGAIKRRGCGLWWYPLFIFLPILVDDDEEIDFGDDVSN
jgi:hypothetical protein